MVMDYAKGIGGAVLSNPLGLMIVIILGSVLLLVLLVTGILMIIFAMNVIVAVILIALSVMLMMYGGSLGNYRFVGIIIMVLFAIILLMKPSLVGMAVV